MSAIRGVLLAGKFRSHRDLNGMSNEAQRNTLIVELAGHTNQPVAHFQSLDDLALAGAGAVMVFLRENKIRDDRALKSMSDDDQRNTLIVEIGGQTRLDVRALQSLSNMDLVLLGLGNMFPGGLPGEADIRGTWIRGILLAGKFRSQHDLNGMSDEDRRNALIVELVKHTNQPVQHFQAMDNATLAGTGAVTVFLRETGIRDDRGLKTMSDDDQRNTLIVELDGQTHLSARLQSFNNLNLVRIGLGDESFFKSLSPPLQMPTLPFVFSFDSFEILTQKADSDHSDSDWLSIVVTVANPVTKAVRTIPAKGHHIEGAIKTGDVIRGPFATDPIDAADSDIVVVNYLLTNLGSSRAEDQFAQSVKITNKVVDDAIPIVGAAVGLLLGGSPTKGFEIGKQIADGFDQVIQTLGNAFDFLNIHIGPPNCNGEVLHDTLTFQPGELARAVHQPASREYTGPQENSRCGAPPRTRVNFTIHQPSA